MSRGLSCLGVPAQVTVRNLNRDWYARSPPRVRTFEGKPLAHQSDTALRVLVFPTQSPPSEWPAPLPGETVSRVSEQTFRIAWSLLLRPLVAPCYAWRRLCPGVQFNSFHLHVPVQPSPGPESRRAGPGVGNRYDVTVFKLDFLYCPALALIQENHILFAIMIHINAAVFIESVRK